MTIRYSGVKALIFDFDGTLSTHRSLMIKAVRQTLSISGVQKTEDQLILEYMNLLNAGIRNFPSIFDVIIERETSQKGKGVLELFTKVLEELIEEAGPPEGVSEALKILKDRGINLAVVSFRRRDNLISLLSKLSLGGLFRVLVTPDDVPRFKPNPDPFLKIAEELKVRVEDCIVVGDESSDISGGRAAGMRTIGVLTGILDEGLMKELGPTSIVGSVAELHRLVYSGQVIVIDSSEPDAGRSLRDYEVLRRHSEEGKLPFQVYMDGQVVGFGIEGPDQVGLSQGRRPAYSLIPIMASQSLSEFAALSLGIARQRGLGYVYSVIDAEQREIISILEGGGLETLDEYYQMSGGLEDIVYESDPTTTFERVVEGNVETFLRLFYESFRDSSDRLITLLFRNIYKSGAVAPEFIESSKKFFTRPDHYSYIVKHGCEAAGILDMYETFFNAIGLLPRYRGRGIGRQSMLFAMNDLRQRGQKTITIRVDVRNIPTICLYKGLGLKVVEHKVRLFKSLE